MTTIINGSSPSITFSDGTTQTTAYNSSTAIGYSQLPTGSVLQVVNAYTSTQVTNTNGTPASIGLSASITPKFSTSKILVLASANGIFINATSGGMATLFIYRNGSNILQFGYILGYLDGTASTNSNRGATGSASYLDSPGTTSAVTYAIYGAQVNNATVRYYCHFYR